MCIPVINRPCLWDLAYQFICLELFSGFCAIFRDDRRRTDAERGRGGAGAGQTGKEILLLCICNMHSYARRVCLLRRRSCNMLTCVRIAIGECGYLDFKCCCNLN